MGLCLLDWSAWRRLPKMSRLDAAAFLITAFAVMSVNAVLAVTIGCSLYLVRWLYERWAGRPARVPVYDVSD
jgi:SulP family sulfate permease